MTNDFIKDLTAKYGLPIEFDSDLTKYIRPVVPGVTPVENTVTFTYTEDPEHEQRQSVMEYFNQWQENIWQIKDIETDKPAEITVGELIESMQGYAVDLPTREKLKDVWDCMVTGIKEPPGGSSLPADGVFNWEISICYSSTKRKPIQPKDSRYTVEGGDALECFIQDELGCGPKVLNRSKLAELLAYLKQYELKPYLHGYDPTKKFSTYGLRKDLVILPKGFKKIYSYLGGIRPICDEHLEEICMTVKVPEYLEHGVLSGDEITATLCIRRDTKDLFTVEVV